MGIFRQPQREVDGEQGQDWLRKVDDATRDGTIGSFQPSAPGSQIKVSTLLETYLMYLVTCHSSLLLDLSCFPTFQHLAISAPNAQYFLLLMSKSKGFTFETST